MKRILITTVAIIVLAINTSSANAATITIAELQAQLQTLMAQIMALQLQQATTVASPIGGASSSTSCLNITRNLSRGSRGTDVMSLQQFLISQNLLTPDSATGFFGALTERAVQQWQKKHSIVSFGTPATTGYGAVGPRTRAAARSCYPVAAPSPLPDSQPASPTTSPSLPPTRPAPIPFPVPVQTPLPISTPIHPPTTNVREDFYNPFGDLWSSRTKVNNNIPIAITLGCYRRAPSHIGHLLSVEEHQWIRNMGSTIVFEECAMVPDPLSPYEPQKLKERIADIKQNNPATKYIGYYTLAHQTSGQAGFVEIDAHEEWFVHKKGAAATRENRLKSTFGGPATDVIDVTNSAYRAYIAPKIAAALTEYGMDGFLADGVYPYVNGANAVDVPDNVRDGWQSGWIALLGEIKRASPSKLVLTNPYDIDFAFLQLLIQTTDGVMLEDPFGPLTVNLGVVGWRDSVPRDLIRRILSYTGERDKYALIVVNTNINGTAFTSTSIEQEKQYMRYYLAAFLMFFQNAKTPLMYYTPNSIGPAFESQAYFTDWNIDIGGARGLYKELQSGVYRRIFENAYVYLNNSSNPYTVVFGACCSLVTADGKRVESYTLPPKSGMIFGGGNVIREI